MPTGGTFEFGPFVLDPHTRRLTRGDEPILLSHHQFELLHCFLSAKPRTLFTKDQLIKRVWGRVVGDNNVEKAVLEVRRALDPVHRDSHIKGIRGVGYQFIVEVKEIPADSKSQALSEELEPFLAFREGRAFLQALTADEIARGRALFEKLVRGYPGDATFLVGLATACSLQYEMTRTDARPNMEALASAEAYARDACRIASEYAEARATLGFIFAQKGDLDSALAALQKATSLEDDNWLHWLRLASCCGGEARLRAARKVLKWMPEYPMARVLAATVFIERGMLAEAEHEIDLAIVQMRATFGAGTRFSCVAVYWIKGLLCLARGNDAEAIAAFDEELALESRGHLYARECCANVWYAIGVCRMRQGDPVAARAAFEEALTRVPRHPVALVGLWLLLPREARPPLPDLQVRSVDAAIANAAALAANDDVAGAVTFLCAALNALPKDSAGGWQIPVEPLLAIQRAPEAWTDVLTTLRGRAM